MKITYLYGNIGTYKSTYAEYITKATQGIILDDDSLYYAISNNTWDLYFKESIGYAVVDMMDEMIKALWTRGYNGVVTVTSLIYPLERFYATTNRSDIQSYIIVTGNGDKKLSMENRRTVNRNQGKASWENVYNVNAASIKDTLKNKLIEKYIDTSHILYLSNSLDVVKSKLEIDTFMETHGHIYT